MAVAIPYLAFAGAGLSAAGSIAGGIAQGKAASYQAQVARNNATIAQQNAAHAASVGAEDTEVAGLKARNRLASTRAGFAANNLDITSGSPADVIAGEQKSGALDTETVANNAALQVYGYGTQAAGYEGQAQLDQAEAGFDPIEGALKGTGSLLDKTSSLISGPPSVPPAYSWMQNTSSGGGSGGSWTVGDPSATFGTP